MVLIVFLLNFAELYDHILTSATLSKGGILFPLSILSILGNFNRCIPCGCKAHFFLSARYPPF